MRPRRDIRRVRRVQPDGGGGAQALAAWLGSVPKRVRI